MSLIENEFLSQIYKDLVNKKHEYPDKENLPIGFYDFYKNFLTMYKNMGMDRQLMEKLLTDLYEKHSDIAEYVYEVLDLVLGHCAPNYQIFKE
jgi:hypothetical protein